MDTTSNPFVSSTTLLIIECGWKQLAHNAFYRAVSGRLLDGKTVQCPTPDSFFTLSLFLSPRSEGLCWLMAHSARSSNYTVCSWIIMDHPEVHSSFRCPLLTMRHTSLHHFDHLEGCTGAMGKVMHLLICKQEKYQEDFTLPACIGRLAQE